MKTTHVGVALIGAGMIAPKHVAALSELYPSCQLRTIVSQRPERAEYLTDHYAHSAPVFSNDISSVINQPDIQIAIVATPPSVRIDLIGKLAEAGKHILLEKPIARTMDEAKRVVDICERANVKLGIVFQHRMRTSTLAANELIRSGNLGRLGVAEIAVPLWRDQSYYDTLGRGTYERDGGGVLLTQAIHTIDLALSLTGPVTSVRAMTATSPLHQMEAEDFAVAGLTFANGAVGSLVASTACFPHRSETITLHFEHGSIHIAADTLQVSWRDGRTETPVSKADNHSADTTVTKHKWHQAIIEDFITAVELNKAPCVSGREGLNSHALIDAIETSSQDQ